MALRRLFIPLILLLATCGASAGSPEAVYADFVRAGREGRWADWASLLDPRIRELTAGMVSGWLRTRAAATPVAEEAAACLRRFGLSDVASLDSLGDPSAFLGAAIPILLRGAGDAEGEFRSIFLPPGDRLLLVEVTGDSASGVAEDGKGVRRVVLHRVDGRWRLVTF